MTADRFESFQASVTRKYRYSSKKPLLGLGEQAVTPIQRGMETSVMLGCNLPVAFTGQEPVIESKACQQLPWSKQADTCRRQLEG
jgi:hypothetical protein